MSLPSRLAAFYPDLEDPLSFDEHDGVGEGRSARFEIDDRRADDRHELE